MHYWEIIADQMSKDGLSWGCATGQTRSGTIHVVDAHRDDGGRFIVRADEKFNRIHGTAAGIAPWKMITRAIGRKLFALLLVAICCATAAPRLSAATIRVTTWNLEWFPNR